MKINEGTIDRIVRVSVGSTGVVAGGFWLSGGWQLTALLGGVAMLVTGLAGRCGIYSLLKINTLSKNQTPLSKLGTLILWGVSFILIVSGSFISIKITRNKFLEDFGKMNGFYKQALFLTGQSKREEAKSNYDQWVAGFQNFSKKYSSYKPFVLRNDYRFNSDLAKVETIISESRSGVYEGDLAATHKKLEEVRPIFQDVFKRNGFSMLAMTLTDFHDSMEKLIDAADEKNSVGVINNYPEANILLLQVEAELNDDSVKLIRNNLNELLELAKNNKINDLSKKAAELKSSFVKVYLVKG